MPVSRTAWVAALATVTSITAGCGGGASTAKVTSKSGGSVHAVSESDAGSTVDARVGDVLKVTLHSTYWQLQAPTGQVLVARGAPSPTVGGPSCPTIPGTGCGTVVATYSVAADGTARLSAHRNACGEAMRCTGTRGAWSVTVRATG